MMFQMAQCTMKVSLLKIARITAVAESMLRINRGGMIKRIDMEAAGSRDHARQAELIKQTCFTRRDFRIACDF
eukprot:222840-Pyramimonas_sp.AAC.1